MLGRKLEYLVSLAKEGHFAWAASACHVSQPTLSAAIQQLEAELGVQIVKRGQRFQGFTKQGELVQRSDWRWSTIVSVRTSETEATKSPARCVSAC